MEAGIRAFDFSTYAIDAVATSVSVVDASSVSEQMPLKIDLVSAEGKIVNQVFCN